MLIIILILLIHITDKEQHIARKVQKNCYKKYTVNRCWDNIGINDLQNSYINYKYKYLSVCLRITPEIEKDFFLQFIGKILFMNHQNLRETIIFINKNVVKQMGI